MHFSLENASFSSSDDQEGDLLLPSNKMINEYNQEYSTIVREIERFLKQIKQSVNRFVAFNNFGLNLNLPNLLHNIVSIDHFFKNKLAQADNHHQNDPKNRAKKRYESSFNHLIRKMGDLLKNFIDCQLEFKKQYFGFKDQKEEQRVKSNQKLRTLHSQDYSLSSITNSSKSSKIQIQQYIESQLKEEKREAQLRITLNERLKPKAAALEIQCTPQNSTTQNLYRLNEKIDRIYDNMKSVKSRQEKLIQMFNLNRVKKLHGPCSQHLPFPSTDVSVIEMSSENDEMDSFLEDYRPTMRDVDTITELGHHPKNKSFMKRQRTLLTDLME